MQQPANEQTFIPYHSDASLCQNHALIFAPHADDEIFGCGGAICTHLAQGASVEVIIATDGSGGGNSQIRRQESEVAADQLGYPHPTFWNYPDRALWQADDLTQRITDALQNSAAQLIYVPSSWEIHPDHQVLCQAVLAAMPEFATRRVVMYEVGVPLAPNWLLDVSPYYSQKQAAMQCFHSQLAQQAYDAQITGLNRFRSYTLGTNVSFAEAFFIV